MNDPRFLNGCNGCTLLNSRREFLRDIVFAVAALADVGATAGAMPVRPMSTVSRDGELATYPLRSADGVYPVPEASFAVRTRRHVHRGASHTLDGSLRRAARRQQPCRRPRQGLRAGQGCGQLEGRIDHTLERVMNCSARSSRSNSDSEVCGAPAASCEAEAVSEYDHRRRVGLRRPVSDPVPRGGCRVPPRAARGRATTGRRGGKAERLEGPHRRRYAGIPARPPRHPRERAGAGAGRELGGRSASGHGRHRAARWSSGVSRGPRASVGSPATTNACRTRSRDHLASFVSADPLCIAIWSVVSLLISYCGSSLLARTV